MLREKIGENIWFSSEQDNKFKTNSISVNFILPLDEETVTQNALVTYLLRMGNRIYKHIVDLNKELNYLYGSLLSSSVEKIGSYQILDFDISFIDDNYIIDGDSIIEKCTDLLISILIDPDLEDGLFCNEKVRIAKQLLIDKIESKINNKRKYAIDRCVEIMFGSHPFSIDKYGNKDEVRSIDRERITAAYKRILSEARIEIILTGRSNSQDIKNMFKSKFSNLKRNSNFELSFPKPDLDQDIKEKEEILDVSQSKMVLGFLIDEDHMSQDQCRIVSVMTTLYGGGVFSKLFVNVREKMSLCYYCTARFNKSVKSIFVDCGIHSENKQKAKKAILDQLDEIRRGNVTQQELDVTIFAIINDLKNMKDSVESMGAWYFNRAIWNTQTTIDQEIDALKKITIEEVIELANKVKLNTVYFLKGLSDDETN